MPWIDYYKLLEKYNGDLQCATSQELERVRDKSEDPHIDLREAEKRYAKIYSR